jgi:hypothetical protein
MLLMVLLLGQLVPPNSGPAAAAAAGVPCGVTLLLLLLLLEMPVGDTSSAAGDGVGCTAAVDAVAEVPAAALMRVSSTCGAGLPMVAATALRMGEAAAAAAA